MPAATHSANAVKFSGGGACAANTDVEALLCACSGMDFYGKKALVLGSGGAARSAVYCLALKGAGDIVIASRNAEQAARVSEEFSVRFPETRFYQAGFRGFEKNCEIIVNATPLGMYGDWKELPETGRALCLADFAYDGLNPTRFLSLSEKAGKVPGIDLLLLQAAFSLRFWTGTEIDAEKLKKETLKRMREKIC